jgi:AcrR family transcriptional regulator
MVRGVDVKANKKKMNSTVNEPQTERQVPEVSHNLRDQRLGPKGRKTREKLLTTAFNMLASSSDMPIILSNVAREASVALTTLYLYFPDIGELLLAVLDRVMDSAEEAFIDRLRRRWPDASLQNSCFDFLLAHYQFWRRHSRVLLMRNSLADSGDIRFVKYRYQLSSQPLIQLLVLQMDSELERENKRCWRIANLLLTGIERTATILSTPIWNTWHDESGVFTDEESFIESIRIEAELMALTISHQRKIEKAR